MSVINADTGSCDSTHNLTRKLDFFVDEVSTPYVCMYVYVDFRLILKPFSKYFHTIFVRAVLDGGLLKAH